jgi:hypothetical protein
VTLWLRNITQAYTQSKALLQRTILADLPEQLQHIYPEGTIIMVVKPLYGIAEASAHWWLTYFKHHYETLGMGTSTYDPCLLITAANSECFGVVGMQTDDTLGFNNTAFANKKSDKLRFMAKEKQSLKTDEPLIFNGCILTVERDTLHLR